MALGPKFNADSILKAIEAYVDSRINSMSDTQSNIQVDITNWHSVLNEKSELKSALEKVYRDAGWTKVQVIVGYTGQRDGDPYASITLHV